MKKPDLFRQFRRELESRWQRLYRLAYAWTHDVHLAKDLVQDTMIKAMQKRYQLINKDSMDAWLFRILANTWRDYCRKNTDTVDVAHAHLQDDSDPEQKLIKDQIIQHVRSSISRLSLDQRQIVTLIDLEGFSYSEVADILTIPIGTVMSRLYRARKQLKQHLLEDSSTANKQKSNPHIWSVK